jgi:hypothetical protein
MKQITGSINYTINVSDKGEWSAEYGQENLTEEENLNSDIAIVIMAYAVMHGYVNTMKEGKNSLKGKDKAHMTQKISKIIAGTFGLSLVADYLVASYYDYIEYLNKNKAAKKVKSELLKVTSSEKSEDVIFEEPMTEEDIKIAKQTHDRLTEQYNKTHGL